MLSLREYQREALDAIYEFFAENSGNPVVSIPTGAGKSLIIATLFQESLEWWPDTRVICLTHVKELIAQNFSELIDIWKEAPAGIHSAGLNHRDTISPIIFAGIQSVYKLAAHFPRTDLIVIDECHLVSRKTEGMYLKFLGDMLRLNPRLKVIGFTATPFRLDSGMMHEGEGRLFTDLVYEANVKDLIEQGYLAPPISGTGDTQINTSGVGVRGGEFIPGQLEAAALDPATIEKISDEIVAAGHNRIGWLVFACGIKHAKLLCDELRNRGIRTECAFGATPSAERASIIDGFKRRSIKALVTVGILTTGFNAKHVDLLAVVRPTKSTGLWIQMVGRGLRQSPETDKQNVVILDFGGNLARHGPIDAPVVKTPNKHDEDDKQDAPTKLCPACGAENLIAARWCGACLTTFPTNERTVETRASKLSVLSNQAPQWVPVESVGYHRHQKEGKPDSLCVTYRSGLAQYREWICVEHDRYARMKAENWWRRRAPDAPIPATVTDALARRAHIQAPREIAVRRTGKWFEVVGEKL
jgi:DNA repair protein RadD